MEGTVLLVVDVQTALIEEHPYNGTKVIANIQRLLRTARAKGLEGIYVRHDDGEGSDLERGSQGWEIYHETAPLEGERIFDKSYNSAFVKTGLKKYLEHRGIDTIFLVGLQTEYCIDTTCKAAFEYGFEVIIPMETNTTFDNEYLSAQELYQFYNEKIWKNRFAKVLPIEEVLELFQSGRH